MGTVCVTTLGGLGLIFGLRWLLATARLATLRNFRRRGRGRGHFLSRTDRRTSDRVFVAICIAGALGLVLGHWTWAPWMALAAVGPAAVLVGVWFDRRRSMELEREAMAVLEALRGLLRSGALSPPAALARISGLGKGQGAARLRSRLETLDRGDSFESALRRFARKLGDSPVGATFRTVAAASHRGLPLLPLLDRVLPELRSEKIARDKLTAVRARAVAQALVASIIPWGLSALIAAAALEPLANPDWVMGARVGAVVLEVLGVYLAWRMTCFR